MYIIDVAEKLRSAEKQARANKQRLWEHYEAPIAQSHSKDFNGIVQEVFNGDGILVKNAAGQQKKVYFSSIKPPREIRFKTMFNKEYK